MTGCWKWCLHLQRMQTCSVRWCDVMWCVTDNFIRVLFTWNFFCFAQLLGHEGFSIYCEWTLRTSDDHARLVTALFFCDVGMCWPQLNYGCVAYWYADWLIDWLNEYLRGFHSLVYRMTVEWLKDDEVLSYRHIMNKYKKRWNSICLQQSERVVNCNYVICVFCLNYFKLLFVYGVLNASHHMNLLIAVFVLC